MTYRLSTLGVEDLRSGNSASFLSHKKNKKQKRK